MASEYEIYRDAHNLVAQILDEADMDDYPDYSAEVIAAMDNLSNKHTDEARQLSETIYATQGVHGNLIHPE